MNNFVDPIQTLPVTNYGTMTMENKQSASRYTLVSPLDQKLIIFLTGPIRLVKFTVHDLCIFSSYLPGTVFITLLVFFCFFHLIHGSSLILILPTFSNRNCLLIFICFSCLIGHQPHKIQHYE